MTEFTPGPNGEHLFEGTVTREELTALAIAHARERGCNCNVETITTEEVPGVYRCEVLHDSWCALLPHPTTGAEEAP